MLRSRLRGPGPTAGLALVPLFLAVAAGCGQGDGGAEGASTGSREQASAPSIQKVTATERVYIIDDLLSSGFKRAKDYDVEGLPGATGAHFGYWGPDPYNRFDYEVRFYRSHEDAVEYGTSLAEERVGRHAKLTPETATWAIGLKDARQCVAVGGGLEAASTCLEPKYFDYAVYGDMVLLCEGPDARQSLHNCAALLAEVK